MTPDEVLTQAKQQYNAVGDAFFSDPELYRHVWHAQNILAMEGFVIENTYTTPTVAGQQQYTFPTNAIAIKRITYNGKPVTRIKMKEDDLLTGGNADTTATGTPAHWFEFDRVIYLRPVPPEVQNLLIYTYDRPQEVSSTATLDVPDEFHLGLATYLNWRMALKDQNFQGAGEFKSLWDEVVARAKQYTRKRRLAAGFNVVRDEDDCLPTGWPP